jgi:hypothetical protein
VAMPVISLVGAKERRVAQMAVASSVADLTMAALTSLAMAAVVIWVLVV